MENNTCNFYIQHHAEINGIKVWHWLIDSPVAQINIVAQEVSAGGEIKKKLFDGNYEKAENYFHKVCRDLRKPNGQPNRTKIVL